MVVLIRPLPQILVLRKTPAVAVLRSYPSDVAPVQQCPRKTCGQAHALLNTKSPIANATPASPIPYWTKPAARYRPPPTIKSQDIAKISAINLSAPSFTSWELCIPTSASLMNRQTPTSEHDQCVLLSAAPRYIPSMLYASHPTRCSSVLLNHEPLRNRTKGR